MKIIDKIMGREKKVAQNIFEFAMAHKDLLIIVADPKTDKLLITFNGKRAINQIKSADGKKTHVVKGILSHSLFKKEIDNFIVSLMDSMKLSLADGNRFYQWLDGALYNIAKALRLSRVEKKQGKKPITQVAEDLQNPSVPVV